MKFAFETLQVYNKPIFRFGNCQRFQTFSIHSIHFRVWGFKIYFTGILRYFMENTTFKSRLFSSAMAKLFHSRICMRAGLNLTQAWYCVLAMLTVIRRQVYFFSNWAWHSTFQWWQPWWHVSCFDRDEDLFLRV